MKPLIWLASYPKSGNTWFRILLANLASPTPADINNLPVQGGIASSRGMFDGMTMVPSTLLTADECDRLRPSVYAALAAGYTPHMFSRVSQTETAGVRFMKTHDAYTYTDRGQALLAGACGALLLVRDPRDVVLSLANHFGSSVEAMIEFMANPTASFEGRADRPGGQLRQQLLGWSGFYRSWLDQPDLRVMVVRYEDLHTAPIETLTAATAFAGLSLTQADIERALRFSDFRILQEQEQRAGFKERARTTSGLFFRRGEAGGWRDELDALYVEQVRSQHKEMMRRFGYCGELDD